MRCLGGHLLLFLAFCSLAFPSSFSECFRQEHLERFWLAPSYEAENPYVYKLPLLRFYSFSFDNSSESLALGAVSLADGNYFLSRLPSDSRKDFASASSALDAASASLSGAKESQKSAHAASLAAQQLASAFFGRDYSLLFLPQPYQAVALIDIFLKASQAGYYAAAYPRLYGEALSRTADALEAFSFAASETASKLDSQMERLSLAGASSAKYSGRARQAYLEAESLLSPQSGFCHQGAAGQAIAEYFSSSPQLPDFSQLGVADYLEAVAGKSENSSTLRMARAYYSLLDAESEMQSEYSGAALEAQNSISLLDGELALLGKERLDLIGDPPGAFPEGTRAQVGSSFSGIYSGLSEGRVRLQEAKEAIGEAKSYAASRSSQAYLANAISRAQDASQVAQSATTSLQNVRTNAESAAEFERQLAQQAIIASESRLGATPSSVSDAQALSDAGKLLEEAKASLAAAQYSSTLGEKFAACQRALDLVSQSMAAYGQRASLPAIGEAEQQLYSLSSLLKAAQSDGLDVSFELGKLSDYKKLLSLAGSPGTAQAIADAAKADEEAVLLRLLETYGGLSEKHASADKLIAELRTSQPNTLPQFDSLSKYFPGGTLDARAAAGSLHSIESQLGAYLAEAQQQVPAHLSYLLSKNARALEISEPPVLGKESRYRATVTTENPSGISYSGSLQFSVDASLPLYSAELASGDLLLDAYPDGAKTTITIPGIASGQALYFTFEKYEQPAQKSSSSLSCALATQEQAKQVQRIDFFASRALRTLVISEPSQQNAVAASARYSGQEFPLSIVPSGSIYLLQGELTNVPSGRNSLEITQTVQNPFAISSGERNYQALGGGQTLVSYEADVAGTQLNCDSAQFYSDEPYEQVSNLTLAPLGAEKITFVHALPLASGTRIAASFAPLLEGATSKFLVSYVLSNSSQALSEALSQAELQLLYYNRSADAGLLSAAKELAAANRTSEALSLLSRLQAQSEPCSYADYQLFLSENSSCAALLSAAEQAQQAIMGENMSEAAGQLSSLSFALGTSLSSAGDLASAGDYKKAADAVRKAESSFRSSLSELAWESASESADQYAKARKASPDDPSLPSAQQEIFNAQKLYSSGEHLQSFIASSRAKWLLSQGAQFQQQSEEQAAAQLQILGQEFSVLSGSTKSLLSNYSSQYSALSGQSKRSLALAPSEAQASIDAAEKSFAAASKAKSGFHQALQQANESYGKMMETAGAIQSALGSLQSSAESSVRVARLALSEVKQKAPESPESSQVEAEVSRAEGFLANSLYADALMSSDRAISAANSLLEQKAGAGLDQKSLLLAGASLAFMAAAAYYFSRKKKGEAKKEKKVPRATDKPEN